MDDLLSFYKTCKWNNKYIYIYLCNEKEEEMCNNKEKKQKTSPREKFIMLKPASINNISNRNTLEQCES